MKRKQRKVTDIGFDVLIHIMLHLSKSSNGAKNLARTSAVCRIFKELAQDPMILQAVTFYDVKLSEIHASFWEFNGMLFRCIRAGNTSALCKAIKTLRISSMEVQIANTRARRRAYDQAINDLFSAYRSAEKQYEKSLAFWLELKEVVTSSLL